MPQVAEVAIFRQIRPIQPQNELMHLTMTSFCVIRPAALLLLLAPLLACQPDEQGTSPTERPNILWLVAEDISPGLGCYGDPLAHTPNIDGLAEQGVVFERAYASAPICAPSRSCLVSGLYATSMGTQHLRCEIPFSDRLQTLPEHLREAGYFTSNRNKTDYNFDPEGRWEHWSSSIAPWRQRTDDRPFFSFINVGPSHEGSVNRYERYQQSIEPLQAEELQNPAEVNVPPYYPDNEASREVWARYYNVMRVMDANVGKVLDSLEADGLMDETIIFFFGDHGYGMPRYKRWLYRTGLQVPLVVYAPPKYQHLLHAEAGSREDKLVSFVDYVPTALNLAGAPIPETMEGLPFLGESIAPERPYVFAARDRADDMFEMSRAVLNDRYIYIRHYMPHLPYMQPGFIYSSQKDGFKVLRDAHEAGETNAEQEELWNPKPVEELYDLQQDPQELNNLANEPELQAVKAQLKEELQGWMTTHRDLGLLTESEYLARAQGGSPYDYARSQAYDVARILETAEMVGTASEAELIAKTADEDSGVRYWAAMGLLNASSADPAVRQALTDLLDDPSPSVQVLAAEALLRQGDAPQAVEVLGRWVMAEEPRIALEAARAIQLVGEAARPLIPRMYEVLEKNLGPEDGPRKYKDFNYAAFTSWALEWALQELGEDIEVN